MSLPQALFSQWNEAIYQLKKASSSYLLSVFYQQHKNKDMRKRVYINFQEAELRTDKIDGISLQAVQDEIDFYEKEKTKNIFYHFWVWLKGFFTGLHQRRMLMIYHDLMRLEYKTCRELGNPDLATHGQLAFDYLENRIQRLKQFIHQDLYGKSQVLGEALMAWSAYLEKLKTLKGGELVEDPAITKQYQENETRSLIETPQSKQAAMSTSQLSEVERTDSPSALSTAWREDAAKLKRLADDIQKSLMLYPLSERERKKEMLSDELEKAYRRCALKYHPDRNPENKEKAESYFSSLGVWVSVQRACLREENSDEALEVVVLKTEKEVLTPEEKQIKDFRDRNLDVWCELWVELRKDPAYWKDLKDQIKKWDEEFKAQIAVIHQKLDAQEARHREEMHTQGEAQEARHREEMHLQAQQQAQQAQQQAQQLLILMSVLTPEQQERIRQSMAAAASASSSSHPASPRPSDPVPQRSRTPIFTFFGEEGSGVEASLQNSAEEDTPLLGDKNKR